VLDRVAMRLLILFVKCVGGGLLIITGIALIPLPGPGIPVILLGLAVLASEFEWAARVQTRLGSFVRRIWRRTSNVGAASAN